MDNSPIDYRNQIQSLESEIQSMNSQEATLADEEEIEPPEKTPRPDSFSPKEIEIEEDARSTDTHSDESEVPQPPRIPGPLESELLGLISKVARLEEGNPTAIFSNDEYLTLQDRVEALEAEKSTWASRHEALFALRDEDVANVIKLRVMLAEERREHAAIRQLRDDDLVNVIKLREQLADKTWKEDKAASQSPGGIDSRPGTSTPTSASGRPKSVFIERRSTATDMWQAAKMAAMEQRALELERANADLLSKLENVESAPRSDTAQPKSDEGHGRKNSDVSSAFEELEQQLRNKDEAIEAARREIASLHARMNQSTTEAPNDTKLRETVTDLEFQLRTKDARIMQLSQPHTQVQAQLLQPKPVPVAASKQSAGVEAEIQLAHDKAEGLRAQKNRLQESMTRKVQDLRRERETLLKDLDRKEDEVADLEGRCDGLERELRATRLLRA
ncbi:MAG: hypothetical protein Q9160_000425 [Pyrenula sp. 1 TL-2023]